MELLNLHRRRALVAAGATAVACAGTPARALMAGVAPDSPRRRLDAIVANSPHACVASVMGGGGVYSAVCIAPTLALTAAHVTQQAGELSLYLNVERDLSHRIAIKRIVRHPAFDRGLDARRPVGDVAVLELAETLPRGLTLPPMASTPAEEGLRIELVGYGASGAGDQGGLIGAHPALRRSGANRIDRLLRADDAARLPLIYLFTFDAPHARASAQSFGSLGNDVETGLAGGDSGSPAFVMEQGRLALLGINTFVAGREPIARASYHFGTVGGGQVLASHRAWLQSVIGTGVWPGLD